MRLHAKKFTLKDKPWAAAKVSFKKETIYVASSPNQVSKTDGAGMRRPYASWSRTLLAITVFPGLRNVSTGYNASSARRSS